MQLSSTRTNNPDRRWSCRHFTALDVRLHNHQRRELHSERDKVYLFLNNADVDKRGWFLFVSLEFCCWDEEHDEQFNYCAILELPSLASASILRSFYTDWKVLLCRRNINTEDRARRAAGLARDRRRGRFKLGPDARPSVGRSVCEERERVRKHGEARRGSCPSARGRQERGQPGSTNQLRSPTSLRAVPASTVDSIG